MNINPFYKEINDEMENKCYLDSIYDTEHLLFKINSFINLKHS